MAIETPAADDFASAFNELAALGEKPVPVDFAKPETAETLATKGEADKAVADAAAAEAAKVAKPEGAETTVEGVEDLTDAEKAALAAETAKVAKAEEPVVTDREADLLAKFAKAVKGEEKTEQKVETPAQVDQTPMFSQEEVTFLTEYNKEWPDVAKAQGIMLRAMSQQITAHIFTEFAKTLGPRLQLLETLADRAHTTDLHTQVEDSDDVRDKVIEWADKQPTYLRDAYSRVISDGSVDEVKDLIDRYRKDAGIPAKAAPAVPAKTVTELSPVAKKAAAALAPVGSKRSAVVSQASPDDFDGAFATAIKELAT